MAIYYVDPQLGSDAADGLSTTTPWKLIPGQSGSNTVSPGDTIRIKNGSTSNLVVNVPQNNLTYQGYGLADNILYLRLPIPENPQGTYLRRMVRTEGSNEGMWTLKDITSSSCFAFGVRTGTVVEDLKIEANTNQGGSVMTIGISTDTTSGATLRRIWITDAPTTAITGYKENITIEYVKIERCGSDGINYNASATNGFRAGSVDRLQYGDFSYLGLSGSTNGDAFQTIVSSNQWLARLYIADIYVFKDARVKQALLLSDATSGILLERFHFKGTETAHTQIGVETCKGNLIIRNGYIEGGCADNAAIRFVTSSGEALGTGAVLDISNVLVKTLTHSGFFTAATVSAATTDGTVNITNCAIEGINTQQLSFSGDFSFHPGSTLTINANTKFNLRNNISNSSGAYAVSLPSAATVTGSPNNWIVKNNAFLPAATFFFATGSSLTLAQFVATHTEATNNIQPSSFSTYTDYTPKTNSSLYHTGILTTTYLDMQNKQRYNPPSIGPMESIPSRGVR